MDAEDEPSLSGKTSMAPESKSKPLPKFPSKTCKYAGVTFRELLLSCASSFCFVHCILHHIRDGDREHSPLFMYSPLTRHLSRQVPGSDLQGQQGIQPGPL
jgi:hypothetical protein